MDRLKQLREPAAVVALVGLTLHLVLTGVYVLLAPVSFDLLLVDAALGLVSPVLVALLTLLVAGCWLAAATPHARGLTVLSLVLTAGLLVTVAGLLVAGLVRAPDSAPYGIASVLLGFVPWLTTTAIALGVFVTLLRQPAVAAIPAAAGDEVPAAPVPAPSVDPQLQPGWSPDAAVGTVWRRAGDAASGAPATSWDAPGQTAGWWGPAPAIETPAYVAPEQPTAGQTPSAPTTERPARRGDWSSPSSS